MEKRLFQTLFKAYMKEQGFRSKGNACYKSVADDYLIVVFLEHCSYRSAYRIVYGVIYEPGPIQSASIQKTDWRCKFLFPAEEPQSNSGSTIVDWFDYSVRSRDDFVRSMDENVVNHLSKLYDKEFVLAQYRKDWIAFRRIPYDTVQKICRLAGLDYSEVVRIRDSSVRKWP